MMNKELDGIQKRYAHIDPKAIRSMRVMAGDVPHLEVVYGDCQKHEFKLTEGWEIYIANDFLRSLNTGYYISFENFMYYDKLVKMCMKRVQERHTA